MKYYEMINVFQAVAAGADEGASGGATDADADLQARLDDLRRE